MLFKINKANDDELTYKGGQSMIVHLEADLCAAVEWAEACGQRWAFSLANAATRYTAFRSNLDQLEEINWVAVGAKYWSAPDLKEGKQAEFLVERSFPWGLVERIGIHARAVAPRVAAAVAGGSHRPRVEVRPDWYY